MTSTTTALQDQIRRVALLRLQQAHFEAVVAEARQAFERDWEADLTDLAKTKTLLAEEERRLRDLVVSEFEATGERKPAPGVSIRLTTALDYTEAEAFAWAKQSGMALALDRKAFEAIAKATDLPFVTRREVPQATLATSLPLEPTDTEVSHG